MSIEDLDAVLNKYGSGQDQPKRAGGSRSAGMSYAGDQPEGGNFLVTGGRFAKGVAKGLAGDVSAIAPHAVGDWARSPSESKAESIGNFVGATTPFVAIGPEGIGGSAIRGAIAGGLQPTDTGSFGSHLRNAALGGAAGALPGVSGAMGSTGMNMLLSLARAAHMPIPHIPHFVHALNELLNRGELSRITSAGLGTAAGKTFDRESSYAPETRLPQ